MSRQNPVALKGWSARVNGFADEWRKDIVPLMLIVSFAVGFVLLIACATVANLMLARAAAPTRASTGRRARDGPTPRARAGRRAQARDQRATGARRLARPRRAPAPHREPAPVADRGGERPRAPRRSPPAAGGGGAS